MPRGRGIVAQDLDTEHRQLLRPDQPLDSVDEAVRRIEGPLGVDEAQQVAESRLDDVPNLEVEEARGVAVDADGQDHVADRLPVLDEQHLDAILV